MVALQSKRVKNESNVQCQKDLLREIKEKISQSQRKNGSPERTVTERNYIILSEKAIMSRVPLCK